MSKSSNMTRQGVRNLDTIPGKSKGKKYEPPPSAILCEHPANMQVELSYGGSTCKACNMQWDWDGKEY